MLYDLYVRFMIWLGAAPPSGYERLLPKTKKVNTQPYSNQNSGFEKRVEGPIIDEEWVTEDELPEWLKEEFEDENWLNKPDSHQQRENYTISSTSSNKFNYTVSRRRKINRALMILVVFIGLAMMSFSVYRWISEKSIQNQFREKGISTTAIVNKLWTESTGRAPRYKVEYQFKVILSDAQSITHTTTETVSATMYKNLAVGSTVAIQYLNSEPIIARIELVPIGFTARIVFVFIMGAMLAITFGFPLIYIFRVELRVKKLVRAS